MKKALPALLLVISYWLLVIGNPQPANAQVTRFPPPLAECSLDKSYEIRPSCAICGDILFCWGNNYRACSTAGVFPPPALGTENRSGYLGTPGNSITYNGQSFPVPSGGVFFCDSNVFGCVNECFREAGASSSQRFEGTTQTVAKTDEAFGGDIEIEERIPVGSQNTSIFASISSRLFENERKIKVPTPPIPSEEAIRKQTPAGFDFKAEVEPLSGRLFTPGCEVRTNDGTRLENVSINSQGAIDYGADPTLGEKIARSTVFQATGVPGHETLETVKVAPEELPEKEGEDTPGKQLDNCPPAGGDPTKIIGRTSQGETTVSVSNFISSIINWFNSLYRDLANAWASLTGQQEVTVITKTRNFTQGYGTLGEKAVGDDGFYNGLILNRDVLSDDPAAVLNEFTVTGSTEPDKSADVAFPKSGKVEDAYKLLQKSLYPESMQGEVEKLGY